MIRLQNLGMNYPNDLNQDTTYTVNQSKMPGFGNRIPSMGLSAPMGGFDSNEMVYAGGSPNYNEMTGEWSGSGNKLSGWGAMLPGQGDNPPMAIGGYGGGLKSVGAPGQAATDDTIMRTMSAGATAQPPAQPRGVYAQNGQFIPAFHVNDIGMNKRERAGYSADSGTDQWQYSFGLKDNAIGKYFPGWDYLNQNNWQFGQGASYEDWVANQHDPMWEGDPNKMWLRVKDGGGGEYGSQNISFKRDGDYWVPELTGRSEMNTGNSFQNRALASIALALAGGAYAAGSGGGGATSGGWGAFGEGAGALTGAGGEAVATGAFGTPGAVSNWGAIGLGGAPAAGAEGLLQLGSGNIPAGEVAQTGLQEPTWFDRLTSGNMMDTARNAYRGYSALNRLVSGGGQGGGQRGGGLGGLAGLIGGLYSADGARDYARDMKEQAAIMRAAADPYLKKLQESYDNPNVYFESPEAQAMLGLEANKLSGIDASRGRMSNDIQRTKLLQDYGAARMNDYRTGLRGAIQSIYKPEAVANLYGAGSRAENQAWNPMFQAVGGQGGGDIGSWIDGLGDIIDGGREVWDWLDDLWS